MKPVVIDSITRSPERLLEAPHTLHVAASHPDASDTNAGSASLPLCTVSEAARRARPGDTVLVHPGIYRERITPVCGGEPEQTITYRAAIPHQAIVRGSDIYRGPWHVNSCFPGCQTASGPDAGNAPFFTVAGNLSGDRVCGQVFVNGRLIPQACGVDELERQSSQGAWRWLEEEQLLVIRPPSGEDLRQADVELAVRNRLFAPHLRGLGHIVIEGFVFEHCANQSCGSFWELTGHPQAGAVSTRSGHHWTIRDCIIGNVNSIGIDCGSEGAYDIEGHQPAPPRDAIGWHVLQSNHLHDCGESGIVGYGCHCTQVIDNCIERCNSMGFNAIEEAGLKFHYFINGLIEGNVIRGNDAHGIWLDNVWHGSRVTRNVCLNNVGSGIFAEMGYGPLLIDHNIVAHTRCGEGIYTHDSSGVTVAHNLLYGNTHFGVYMRTVSDRQVELPDGSRKQVATRGQRIIGNVFIDNYRGHLCLPADSREADNQSDYNLFVNGTQWHWEGQDFHQFVLNDNEGRITTSHRAASHTPAGQCQSRLNLDQWRAVTSNDLHSHVPPVLRGAIENGAVAKGAFSIAAQGMHIAIRDTFLLTHAGRFVPAVVGLDKDFYGHPLPEGQDACHYPGPFVEIAPGNVTFSLIPAR